MTARQLTVNGVRLTPETIIKTREHFAEIDRRCIEGALIGAYGTEAEARARILAHVVKEADGGRWWKAEAIPQEDYDEMEARLRAEAE